MMMMRAIVGLDSERRFLGSCLRGFHLSGRNVGKGKGKGNEREPILEEGW